MTTPTYGLKQIDYTAKLKQVKERVRTIVAHLNLVEIVAELASTGHSCNGMTIGYYPGQFYPTYKTHPDTAHGALYEDIRRRGYIMATLKVGYSCTLSYRREDDGPTDRTKYKHGDLVFSYDLRTNECTTFKYADYWIALLFEWHNKTCEKVLAEFDLDDLPTEYARRVAQMLSESPLAKLEAACKKLDPSFAGLSKLSSLEERTAAWQSIIRFFDRIADL